MMKQYNYHNSVFLNEVIDALNIHNNGIYVDCTFGRGGHSKLVDQFLNDGTIIVIDKDLDAIKHANKIKSSFKNKLIIVHDDFVNISKILGQLNIKHVDGFLLDLGVSSPQIDDPNRGFSYMQNVNLDMRMDQSKSLDAQMVLNTYSLEQLTQIFIKYGECKSAFSVAQAIVKYRQQKPITTSFELLDIIKKNHRYYKKNQKIPYNAFFQAIRIEVNNELNILKDTILECSRFLNKSGRICVITFHSLEDKIIKNEFNYLANLGSLPSYLPIDVTKKYKIYKPIKPTTTDIENNSRCHSAKLRVIERI